MHLRRSLRSVLSRCLGHRRGRYLSDRRNRAWLINVGVRRRIRPRYDITDKTQRQVCGAEYLECNLSILLRRGAWRAAASSVCRLVNTRHIVSHSPERDLPTVRPRPGEVCNGPASRDWQAPEQQTNTDCAKGHLALPWKEPEDSNRTRPSKTKMTAA